MIGSMKLAVQLNKFRIILIIWRSSQWWINIIVADAANNSEHVLQGASICVSVLTFWL